MAQKKRATPAAPPAEESAPPARGSPRKCKTPGCGTAFFVGKKVEGYATGYGDHCHRCHAAIRKDQTPGPRKHQPAGEARRPLKSYIRPELSELITGEVLKRFGVENEGQLGALALARLLGREELR